MKAEEQIYSGDMIVVSKTGYECHRMATEEAGSLDASNPFGYAFDNGKISGISAGNYKKGEEVALYDLDDQPVFSMQK